MSLFIGNISYETTEKEIEELFSKYGKCKINLKRSYAFAAFEDHKDAEKAKEELNSKKLGSKEINIEWCKSKPRGERERDRDRDRTHDSKDIRGKCYNCNRYGHYARDCPDYNSRRRYIDKRKSHAPYKYRRSRSRSRSRNYYSSHKRRGWRDELDRNNRSRSSSKNNDRYYGKRRRDSDSWGRNSFGSRSRSWSKSRSKSKSRNKNGDRDRDKDRDRDRYRNMGSRSRTNSREKYYERKEKSNDRNWNENDDNWGYEKKVEDLKE